MIFANLDASVRHIGIGRKIVFPDFILSAGQVLRQADVRHIFRSFRMTKQLHSDLMRELVAFFHIALPAATDEVLPRRGSPGVFGNDVIYRHVSRRRPAVLTGVVVSREDGSSREFQLWKRAADMTPQLNDRGQSETPLGSRHALLISVQNIRFAEIDHDDRPTNMTNIERLVVAVQDKHFLVHAVSHPFLTLLQKLS